MLIKEGGEFCYRNFTSDDNTAFLGALIVCRYQHQAELIETLPSAEEFKQLEITDAIWIANKEDASFSLNWNEDVPCATSVITVPSRNAANQHSPHFSMALAMCSAKITFISLDFTILSQQKTQAEQQLFTYKEATDF